MSEQANQALTVPLEAAESRVKVSETGTQRLLFALALQSGGTPETNQDLMQALAQRQAPAAECYLLHGTGQHILLSRWHEGRLVPVQEHTLPRAIEAFPHQSSAYDEIVRNWLVEFGIHLVHVRHSAWQSLGLIETAHQVGVPVVYSFHDYYTVCPTVKLLDEQGRFCGGRCTPSTGPCLPEVWPEQQVQPLKHNRVYAWQQQFASALSLCSEFISTSTEVRKLVRQIYPALASTPFSIIPHGRDFPAMSSLAIQPEPGETVRILVPGHIARAKGADVLLALARHPALKQVEWHVLGQWIHPQANTPPGNIYLHGEYQRENFQAHVADIQPHLGAVLSVWPETWCHTLTEMWAAGIPVLGFNLGAVGERIQMARAGWLAEAVTVDAMAQAAEKAIQPGEWARAQANVIQWQEIGHQSCAAMADAYWAVYQPLFHHISDSLE